MREVYEFDREVNVTAEIAMDLFPNYVARLKDGEDIYYFEHIDILDALRTHGMEDNYKVVFRYYGRQVNTITYVKI